MRMTPSSRRLALAYADRVVEIVVQNKLSAARIARELAGVVHINVFLVLRHGQLAHGILVDHPLERAERVRTLLSLRQM